MKANLNFIDPNQLNSVSDLELQARMVVEGFLNGVHRGPNTGSSVEFSQYRSYGQGDDLRLIDWKLFGRTDRLHVKQFREESGMRCSILLDCSGSMDFGSQGVTKFAYARMLCAALALLLKKQGDGVGFFAYHHELLFHMPPGNHARHFRKIFSTLANLLPAEGTDTPGALKFLGNILKPRGMVILISDLLHPADEMIEHLKSIRARRHDVLVFQISDPAERDFSFDHALTLVDAEDGREQYVVPKAVRQEYLEKRNAHFRAIHKEALASEIEIHEFSTTQPLDYALRQFLHKRARSLVTTGRTKR